MYRKENTRNSPIRNQAFLLMVQNWSLGQDEDGKMEEEDSCFLICLCQGIDIHVEASELGQDGEA